jgi:hypothetical protein
MKKTIAMLLCAALMLTLFVGCKSSETQEPTTEPTTEAPTETTTETTEETTEEITEETPAVDTSSLEGIINGILSANPVEFSPMVMPLDLTDTSEDGLWAIQSYTGLENAESITEGAFCEAMIGAIPFSLVMVRTAEGADVNAVADAMKAGINQRKWVCVMADDLQVVAKDDIVMLIMIGSDYGTSQSFVDAFTTLRVPRFGPFIYSETACTTGDP